MTLAEAIKELRGDIASVELSDTIGVSIGADWPQRMAMVLASHDKLVAALREMLTDRDAVLSRCYHKEVAEELLADLTEEQEP